MFSGDVECQNSSECHKLADCLIYGNIDRINNNNKNNSSSAATPRPRRRCACYSGYAGDGHSWCFDVNECSDSRICPADATCVNSMGTYACVCRSGFIGDGRRCFALFGRNEGVKFFVPRGKSLSLIAVAIFLFSLF